MPLKFSEYPFVQSCAKPFEADAFGARSCTEKEELHGAYSYSVKLPETLWNSKKENKKSVMEWRLPKTSGCERSGQRLGWVFLIFSDRESSTNSQSTS